MSPLRERNARVPRCRLSINGRGDQHPVHQVRCAQADRPRSVTATQGSGDARVCRTVYRYGSLAGGHFGDVVLRRDGSVSHYRHPNETAYRITGDTLAFFDAAGSQTSTLTYAADVNAFVSREAGLYLLPVLELPAVEPDPQAAFALLVNTIPKSGTYLLEAAAVHAGLHRTRLHLTAHFCDDYRGLPDAEMHAAPEQHRRAVPAAAVAQILQPGEVVVGHIDDHAQLDGAAPAGVRILHCVRDLRAVLASLYRFKRQVVRPISPADTVWRGLGEAEGFLAFLGFFADRDVAHVGRTAACILERGEPRLRFEDLTGAADLSSLQAQLVGWDAAAAAALATGVVQMRGRPTPTLLAGVFMPQLVWSETAEEFFQDTGLARLNAGLGYSGDGGWG